MPFDYAVHSDLLVYWTGKDIDAKRDGTWHRKESSKTDDLPGIENAYLERLKRILKYGLWMTTPKDTNKAPDSETTLYFNKSRNVSLPEDTPRVCFTELRLSLARTHAKRYGRLGIGVKRPFVLDRGGRHVIYLGRKASRERDPFFCTCDRVFEKADRALLHFLKPMNSGQRTPDDLYAESEWRIVYFGDLLDPCRSKTGFPSDSHKGRCSVCVRADEPSREYFDSLSGDERKEAEQRLQYLLPLDGWLSCIIYPSVSLKRQATAHPEIRQAICRIKEICAAKPQCRANDVEKGNWPVEIDLDLCRNL